MENPHDIAKLLGEHDDVHGVRASPRRIVVVHAPDERHVEQVPQSVVDHVAELVEDTVWQREYSDPGRNAEAHSWSGGVHHDPVLSGGSQPAGYELQISLVR